MQTAETASRGQNWRLAAPENQPLHLTAAA
jgi:hypothetical protein